MGTRGPKSAAETAVAPMGAVGIVARQDAPYDLRDEESEVWKGIVESLPADWFTPGSAPVLAAYCRATVSARRIGMLIVQAETEGEYDLAAHMALIKAHNQISQVIKTLATSLRLTPQSRYSPRAAGSQKPDGPKPWEHN